MQFNLHLIEEIIAMVEEVVLKVNCGGFSASNTTKTK